MGFSFLLAIQWGLFLLPNSWFASIEVWVTACQSMCLWVLFDILPYMYITAMVSVNRPVLTVLMRWWETAVWQMTFRSPPSLCLKNCLPLLGLSDSSKSWNVHIPGREPPAEWVSTSGAPCWTPSPTSMVYLGWILLHSVHLRGVNRRKPVSQLIQGVIPFPVLATPLEKQLRWLPLQQQSKRRYRL